MKYFFYILLFSTSAFSQNYHYAINNEKKPNEFNGDNLILKMLFDDPKLSEDFKNTGWYPELTTNHSFQLKKNINRSGSYSGRFEIRKTDPKIYGGYRAEIGQPTNTALEEGWYGFSQYFPDTFVFDSTAEVVGQWHDVPDKGETASRSPSNALIASEDKLKWMVRWDADRIMKDGYSDGTIYIDLGKIPKNKWIDWVVHIKFAHDNTGVLEVWKDGKKVINRQNMPNCYNDQIYPYFKIGVYKWVWGHASKRVIYYDQIRIGNAKSNYNGVKPR